MVFGMLIIMILIIEVFIVNIDRCLLFLYIHYIFFNIFYISRRDYYYYYLHNCSMIKEVYAQSNLIYLQKLFDAYLRIKDEEQIVYIGGRIIQSEDESIDKTVCVFIFDTFYGIFNQKRKSCRQVLEIEALENKNGNRKRLKSIKEYKGKLFSEVSQFLTRLINDINKGIKNNQNKNRELEAFLQFNLSDYKRYLCEVTLDPLVKEEYIKETEECYKRYFQMLTDNNVCEVSPASITGHYHYSIFMFEVKNTKNEAIKYLKDQRL